MAALFVPAFALALYLPTTSTSSLRVSAGSAPGFPPPARSRFSRSGAGFSLYLRRRRPGYTPLPFLLAVAAPALISGYVKLSRSSSCRSSIFSSGGSARLPTSLCIAGLRSSASARSSIFQEMLGGDYSRFNTIFQSSLNFDAWILLGTGTILAAAGWLSGGGDPLSRWLALDLRSLNHSRRFALNNRGSARAPRDQCPSGGLPHARWACPTLMPRDRGGRGDLVSRTLDGDHRIVEAEERRLWRITPGYRLLPVIPTILGQRVTN